MDKINVGKIVGVHGIKGQVKVEVLTDNPKRFMIGSCLWCEKNNQWLTVESSSYHKELLLVKFMEISDRDGAEKLVPSYLKIDRKDVAPLPEGHYYYFEIEGLSVYEKEAYLGKIISVQATGANDIYNVKMSDGKLIAIPALKSVIKKIDIASGTMEVEIPEGLL